MNNHYNSNLKLYARELRTETVSKAEKYIWKALLSRNKLGYKFKRQRPINYFIVDFFCADLKLIIEIDGSSHLNKGEYDFYREEKLKSLGYEIIRFTEGEVMQNLSSVHEKLAFVIYCLEERKKSE
jgi:very-short-patch-repair endonuclease